MLLSTHTLTPPHPGLTVLVASYLKLLFLFADKELSDHMCEPGHSSCSTSPLAVHIRIVTTQVDRLKVFRLKCSELSAFSLKAFSLCPEPSA